MKLKNSELTMANTVCECVP